MAVHSPRSRQDEEAAPSIPFEQTQDEIWQRELAGEIMTVLDILDVTDTLQPVLASLIHQRLGLGRIPDTRVLVHQDSAHKTVWNASADPGDGDTRYAIPTVKALSSLALQSQVEIALRYCAMDLEGQGGLLRYEDRGDTRVYTVGSSQRHTIQYQKTAMIAPGTPDAVLYERVSRER